MKVCIFRSVSSPIAPEGDRDYMQTHDTRYADRVIGNLRNEESFCTACGPDCVHCRRSLILGDEDGVAGVVSFPAVLPHVLERPEEHVPDGVPPHDVLVAIHIHEQILVECVKQCAQWGTRAIVVPREAPDWVSHAAMEEVRRACRALDVEAAFPKPFCSLRPPRGSLLAEFRERFRIGYPDVALSLKEGRIATAHVAVSAPCGATHYIARWLRGRGTDDELRVEVVGRRMHSYPCTASMAWDAELGDTVLHEAGENHYAILDQLGRQAADGADGVLSPFGRTLPRPVPVAENRRNVEQARETILRELEAHPSVTFDELKHKIPASAAIASALIILRKEGRIRMEGKTVVRT